MTTADTGFGAGRIIPVSQLIRAPPLFESFVLFVLFSFFNFNRPKKNAVQTKATGGIEGGSGLRLTCPIGQEIPVKPEKSPPNHLSKLPHADWQTQGSCSRWCLALHVHITQLFIENLTNLTTFHFIDCNARNHRTDVERHPIRHGVDATWIS